MGTRILAVSATPRKRGNSDILTDFAVAGAAQAGADVQKVRLAEMDIRPCTACNACQHTIEAPCVQQDDMLPLLDRTRETDAFLLASPIYFCAVNAQMKAYLDRWIALFGCGRFDTLRGRRAGLILTYGDSDPLRGGAVNALRMFQDAFYALGVKLTGWVHAPCMDEGEIEENEDATAAARELGKHLAQG